MLRFFSKIRYKLAAENKPMKYTRYAIGEILLVVIGILIALQINIWNERRKEYNQIENYAKSLVKDIEEDIAMVDTINYTAKQIAYRIDSLSNYVRMKKIREISNLKLLSFTWMPVYRPYSWNRATFDELKSSGSLRLIENKTLMKKIVEYDSFTRHMDEDYYNKRYVGTCRYSK